MIPANLDDIEWIRGINGSIFVATACAFQHEGRPRALGLLGLSLQNVFHRRLWQWRICGAHFFFEAVFAISVKESRSHMGSAVSAVSREPRSSFTFACWQWGLRKKRKTTRCVCHPFIRVHKIFLHLSSIYIRQIMIICQYFFLCL